MAYGIYKRYMWLVRSIMRSRNGLTFEEIKEEWRRSALNEDGAELSKRTFRNWILAIEGNLGLYIQCTKGAPYRYYIHGGKETEDDLMVWALNAFSIGQMAAENNEIKHRILLEEIPSADARLDIITSAMRNNHEIRMLYKRFGQEKVMEITTKPYALKLSGRRWYLIVHSDKRHYNYTYSLDRIIEVEETKKTFKMDENYSVKSQFAHYVGVDTSVKTPAETVRVKVFDPMRDYITTLPLHHSQEVETEDENFTIFRYHLIPNNELLNALGALGENCEILEPKSLRKAFCARAEKVVALNK